MNEEEKVPKKNNKDNGTSGHTRYPLRSTRSSNSSTSSHTARRYPLRSHTNTTIRRVNLQTIATKRSSKNTLKKITTTTTTKTTTLSTKQNTTPRKLSPNEIIKRNLIINPLVESLFTKKLNSTNNRLGRDEYTNIIKKYKSYYPWITEDIIKQRIKRKFNNYKKKNQIEQHASTTTIVSTPTRNKGGRPIGTTDDLKRHTSLCLSAAKSEICDIYTIELKKRSEMGCSRGEKGSYNKIFNEVKSRRNLPDSFKFPYSTAKKRMRTKTLLDGDCIPIGKQSPLYAIEKDIVDLLIILSKIGSPVSRGNAIRLINEMIDGTIHQQRLKTYKKSRGFQQSEKEMGCVTQKYWYRFLEKYQHKITSKKGRRYELDRSKWTRYKNFHNMYTCIEEEMVDAGVAVELDVPVYMDHVGNLVSGIGRKEKIKGMKVKVDLRRPDMCIVLDEVGASLNMTNDGNIGGRRYICAKGDEPKTLSSKKDKHFTCLGLTALNGLPVMCVVVIDSVKENPLVRTGVDTNCLNINVETHQGDDEFSFFERNLGEEKLYPGGPSCMFKGKKIPCMIEFSSGGGMTGEILTKIFQTLDALEVYKEDREMGLRPFILLDGHQTRFELEFLTYVNDPVHRWSVCIGVPYGTALWQVGDSTEQNGNFKMSMNRKKEEILDKRISSTVTGDDLVPTDIIPLVVYSWKRSFAGVDTNKKAIYERGWYPLNRMLLLDPVLRETMTERDVQKEKEEGLNPMHDRELQQEFSDEQQATATSINQGPTMRVNNNSNVASHGTLEGINTHDINFGNGLTQYYIKNIIRKTERERVLEKIQEDKKTDETFLEQLGRVNRVSAGSLVKCGSYVIGKDVEEVMKKRIEIKRNERKEKKDKEEELYNKQRKDADLVIEKNKGKSVTDWTATDLKVLLKPEKMKEDGAMPQSKKELVGLYKKCVGRSTRMGLLCSPTVGSTLLSTQTIVPMDVETTEATQPSGNDEKGYTEM
jgi:hypothetical protein